MLKGHNPLTRYFSHIPTWSESSIQTPDDSGRRYIVSTISDYQIWLISQFSRFSPQSQGGTSNNSQFTATRSNNQLPETPELWRHRCEQKSCLLRNNHCQIDPLSQPPHKGEGCESRVLSTTKRANLWWRPCRGEGRPFSYMKQALVNDHSSRNIGRAGSAVQWTQQRVNPETIFIWKHYRNRAT